MHRVAPEAGCSDFPTVHLSVTIYLLAELPERFPFGSFPEGIPLGNSRRTGGTYFCIFSTSFGINSSRIFCAASSNALNAPFSNVSLIPLTLFIVFL